MSPSDDEKAKKLRDKAPVCEHIYLPGNRPLCGGALPTPDSKPPENPLDMDRRQFAQWVLETLQPQACGPCLILAGNLRFQASVLRRASDDEVYPQNPADAWRLTLLTPWSTVHNVRPFLAHMDELKMSYTNSDFQVDETMVEEHLQPIHQQRQKAAAEYWEAYSRERKLRRDADRPDYEAL